MAVRGRLELPPLGRQCSLCVCTKGLLGADGRKAGILAALNRADPDHDGAREALRADRGPLIVPAGILAEAGYMVEVDRGAAVLRQFVSDLHDG